MVSGGTGWRVPGAGGGGAGGVGAVSGGAGVSAGGAGGGDAGGAGGFDGAGSDVGGGAGGCIVGGGCGASGACGGGGAVGAVGVGDAGGGAFGSGCAGASTRRPGSGSCGAGSTSTRGACGGRPTYGVLETGLGSRGPIRHGPRRCAGGAAIGAEISPVRVASGGVRATAGSRRGGGLADCRVVLARAGRPARRVRRWAWKARSATRRSGAGWMTEYEALFGVPADRSIFTPYEPTATAAASARPPAWRRIVIRHRASSEGNVDASPPADRRRAHGCRGRVSPHPLIGGALLAVVAAGRLLAVRALLRGVLLALLRGLVLRGGLAL